MLMKTLARPTAVALLLLAQAGLAKQPTDCPEPTAAPDTDKHYRVYDGKGTPTTLDAMLQRLHDVDVVFLGESHDDPVAHLLQARLLRQLHERRRGQAKPRPLALALEMFERDVQPVLDEYLAGLITEKAFRDSSRPWNNYEKDYRPLVEFAREQHLPVIAANAPRRYVNRVSRLGAASLADVPEPQRRGLPPLPYAAASPAYAARFQEIMKKHTPSKTGTPPEKAPKDAGHGIEAQSLWDATMAYSVAEFLLHHSQAHVVHVNGSFHSAKRMGIPEHLVRYRPGTSFLVVTMTPHKGFPEFAAGDLADAGDFVIVTDPALPRSFTPKTPPKK
jgi:uncharacterized iron-regulated protein